MSVVTRQRTCAACGRSIQDTDPYDLETIIDGQVRHVAVHHDHCTCFPAREPNTERNQP